MYCGGWSIGSDFKSSCCYSRAPGPLWDSQWSGIPVLGIPALNSSCCYRHTHSHAHELIGTYIHMQMHSQAHTLTCTWTHRHIHSRAHALKCIFSERKKWDMNIYVLEKVNITFCKCDLSTDQFILYSVLSGFCLCISQSDHMLSMLIIMLNFIMVRIGIKYTLMKKRS